MSWKSLYYVKDFKDKLDNLNQYENEKFVREIMSEFMLDAPLKVIEAAARAVLAVRLEEFNTQGDQN